MIYFRVSLDQRLGGIYPRESLGESLIIRF